MDHVVFKTYRAKLKRLIKDFPVIWSIYRQYTERKIGVKYRNKGIEEVFTTINTENLWNNRESISGPGSTHFVTNYLVTALPGLLNKYDIRSILDAPCGDFHWMQMVDLSNVNYMGADIVEQLIIANNNTYGARNISFIYSDITKDTLPPVDLIIVRDCLVHFNDNQIFDFFCNLCRSEISFLLTTNFPLTKHNYNITCGNWRPINLMRKPYSLPKEIDILWEKCEENRGQYPDKSLYLWKVNDLKPYIKYQTKDGSQS